MIGSYTENITSSTHQEWILMAELKNNLLSLLTLLSICSFSLSCNAADKIIMDNSLKDCLQLNNTSITRKNNLLLLEASLHMNETIGACGCKSAAFSYSVYRDKNEKFISYGMLSSINKNKVTLVLSSDNSIYKDSKYKVSISCSN